MLLLLAISSAASFLILGLIIYFNRPRSWEKIIFSILCLETFAWQSAYTLSFFTNKQLELDFLSKLAYTFIVFLPFTYYHFAISFLRIKETKSVVFFYVICFIFLLILWPTDLFILGHRSYDWGHYASAGILHPIYLGTAFYALLRALYLLWRAFVEQSKSKDALRVQYLYMFVGFAAYFISAIDFVSLYGISCLPIGSIFQLISFCIISYAITRHQLMNIEVIVRRTAVFAGLFAFTYGIFTTLTVVGQDIFQHLLGWNQWVAMIPTVIIVTFALRPLENFLTRATERFLFQKKYDYRDLLKTFTNEVLTVLDLQKLTEQTIVGLNKIIKLESASIFLRDDDNKSYRMATFFGIKDKAIIFTEKNSLIFTLVQTHQSILKDKSADHMEGFSDLRDDFKKINAHLCLPISHHDNLIGILSLGMKKSGEEFTEEDIDILMTLARTLGIAIANAKLFDQLSKTQAEAAQREKMAVIGTLAAGINHEICNPLGIVRGQCEMFLLNLRDGIYSQKSIEDMIQIASEIMNKVIKETDRATAITKRLSGFAKPVKKIDMDEVSIEKEAEEVIGLIGHDLKLNNIIFEKEFAAGFPNIIADKRQIQEVLFNLMRNAAQAMDKKDGKIMLAGSINGDVAVVKISDNGMGIPPDKLNQIFNPFFTTKEPGKGTGLGLFIVRQVIERNKGTIAVESEEGVGTSFTLTFPVATHQSKVLAA